MSVEPERYARLHAIFREARALESQARASLLEERCGADAALLAEVEELLAAFDDEDSDLFSESGIDRARKEIEGLLPHEDGEKSGTSPEADWLPERVGRYRVVRRIGEGGMGVVYEAEQDSPKRRVAIKLLHPLQATPERLKRFRHEAELLGRLQHPGIAQIHEAGTYDLGRGEQPFFAMELVDGVSIRAFADRAGLDVRARLALVAQVADAVHHAHGRGVIHRDLKPDNVLVDERGQPKVLDFGVARAAESSDIVSTLMTQEGVLMGTLAYMAPEQLAGDSTAISPRTDVYALGVIAFELLTGRLPHEIGGLQLPAAMKVLENEPTRSLGALEPGLRGDVETIVTKALEKEPHRRYASAEALATDIGRHLDHLPIAARPPSRAYLVKKYVRRNRSLVAVLGIALVAAVVSGLFGLRATHARGVAERWAAQSTLMTASLTLEKGPLAAGVLESIPAEHRGWEWRHLDARRSAPLARIDGEARAFREPQLLPDGRTLLTCTLDGVVSWIDADSGELERQVRLDLGTLITVASSASGRELLVAGIRDVTLDYRGAQVCWFGRWDLERHALVSRHEFDAFYRMVRFDPERDRLFASDKERGFVIDARSGERLKTLEQSGMVTIAGDHLGLPSEEGTWILDGETLATIRLLPEVHGKLSPDGNWLTAVSEGNLDLWDLSASPPERRRFKAESNLRQGWISPDGAVLVTQSRDNLLRAWDLRTEEPLESFAGHSGQDIALLFLAGARRVLICDRGGEIHAWDYASSPFQLDGHVGFVYPVALAVEHGLIASGGWDGHFGSRGCLRLWDLASGDPVASLGEPGEIVVDMAPSPSGSSLYLAFMPKGSRNPPAVARIEELELSSGQRRELFPGGASGGLVNLAGGRLAWTEARYTDSLVVVADVESREVLHERRFTSLPLEAAGGTKGMRVTASPDGAWLAVGGRGELELWRSDDLEPLWRVPSEEERLVPLAFSPDSRRLACASGRSVLVFSVQGGTELARLDGHAQAVLCAAFSPDGTRIASGGRDQTVRIWDAETYAALCELSGHELYVYSLTWSPDSELLVSGSGDKTVRLWNGETANQRAVAHRERARILERVEPQVLRFLEESDDPEQVHARIEAHPAWTPRERQVASQVLLREVIGG